MWALENIVELTNKIGETQTKLLDDIENEDFDNIRERAESIKDTADDLLNDLEEVEPVTY